MVIIGMGRFIIVCFTGSVEVAATKSGFQSPMAGEAKIQPQGKTCTPISTGNTGTITVRITVMTGLVVEITQQAVCTQIEPTVSAVSQQPETGFEAVTGDAPKFMVCSSLPMTVFA